MTQTRFNKKDLATEHLLIKKGQKLKIQKLAKKQGMRVTQVVTDMLIAYQEKRARTA